MRLSWNLPSIELWHKELMMQSRSEIDALADLRKQHVRDLKNKLNRILVMRNKHDMTWIHWFIFAPFWAIVGIFSPEKSFAFWNHYITVAVFFGTVIYVPDKWMRKLLDEWSDDDPQNADHMPDWWYTTLVHEQCHVSQRKDDGALKFIYRYGLSKQERFNYELEAYLTDFFIHGVLGSASLNHIGSIADKLSKPTYMMKPSHLHQDEWETVCFNLVAKANDFIRTDKNLHDSMKTHGDGVENIVAPESVLLYTRSGEATAHCRLPYRLRNHLRLAVAFAYKE
jgi:hypothetical protein